MITSSNNWIAKFNEYVDVIENSLLTGKQFTDNVNNLCFENDSPFAAIHFEVHGWKNFDLKLEFGIIGEGSPQSTDTLSYKHIQCKMRVWYNNSYSQGDNSIQLKKLFDAFWKETLRDSKSYLIKVEQEKVIWLRDKFMQTKGDCEFTVLIFGDLDKFSLINDFVGMSEGDQAIFEFGTLLSYSLINEAVVLHRSGDEFVAIFHCDSLENVLVLLHNTTMIINLHDFNLHAVKEGEDKKSGNFIKIKDKLTFSVSFGASYITKHDILPDYEAWFKHIESVIAKKNKGPHGTTRIASYYEYLDDTVSISEALYYKALYCLFISNLDKMNPFSKIWLNVLSFIVSQCNHVDSVSSNISSFLCWVKHDTSSNESVFSIKKGLCNLAPQFSNAEMVVSIAHGILRNKNIEVSKLNIIKSNENFILSCDAKDSQYNLVEFTGGKECIVDLPLNFASPNAYKKMKSLINKRSKNWAKKAILVKIGHEKANLPYSIFSEVVIVDDRPTKGGALPDFWEPIIAQIVAVFNNNKNLSKLIIYGNKEHGKEIVNLLVDISNWDEEHIQWISEKTKTEIRYLHNLRKRLTGNVYHENDTDKIINYVYDLYSSNDNYEIVNDITSISVNRILARKANINDFCLKSYDGIRVASINEAYPIMLDIARNLIGLETFPELTDQAGRNFIEISDFKVHLSNPMTNMIPHFFIKKDVRKMNDYYKVAFCEEGLFYKALSANGQYEHVISHIIESTTKEPYFATRRAILVVPNLIDKTSYPLGLVSVRIMPRIFNNKIKLNYSYTWRTVESVIGFPYSIYGSVKFSEQITDALNKVAKSHEFNGEYVIDTITYLAHSLHMFTDMYSQEIIRGIVSDASK